VESIGFTEAVVAVLVTAISRRLRSNRPHAVRRGARLESASRRRRMRCRNKPAVVRLDTHLGGRHRREAVKAREAVALTVSRADGIRAAIGLIIALNMASP
jgi:hypothetical protein